MLLGSLEKLLEVARAHRVTNGSQTPHHRAPETPGTHRIWALGAMGAKFKSFMGPFGFLGLSATRGRKSNGPKDPMASAGVRSFSQDSGTTRARSRGSLLPRQRTSRALRAASRASRAPFGEMSPRASQGLSPLISVQSLHDTLGRLTDVSWACNIKGQEQARPSTQPHDLLGYGKYGKYDRCSSPAQDRTAAAQL